MWELKEYNKALQKEERPLKAYKGGDAHRFVLCYPNEYEVGMTNLGFLTLYDTIMTETAFWCDRCFMPPDVLKDKMEEKKDIITSFERGKPLSDFHVIGFSVSFELDYLNFLWMMSRTGLQLHREERNEKDPLIVMGGPCMTFNPFVLSDFVDVFFVGEGEDSLPSFCSVYDEYYKEGKDVFLREVAKVPGIYVP